MAELRASKPKGKKLDSIISKLKIHPSQEAIDAKNEPSNTPTKEETEVDKSNKANDKKDSERKKSRKPRNIVRYRIDDTDDEMEITEIERDEDKDENLPESIFEDIPNGEAELDEDTTVLFVPADEIQVRTGPTDDYLGDLLDGGQDSNQDEEVEQETKGTKKKKKKKKNYDSDESVDENGLPRRVTCTGCGRKVNPSHGTILRHPVLNVLVCKKCNQYYNTGPFTRDEYGIEEQCRWCGDGGDLICCDHCEKVYCKQCIQRNCGKTYLKNLLNAPDDFKWFCIVCEKDRPIKHVQRLRKKCEQVMQALENLKAEKAHFKNKKGQQASVVSGPTTSERRNRLNCLSEGIKAEGFSSSGETPTKTEKELPPTLFNQVDEENREESDKEEEDQGEKSDRKEEQTTADIPDEMEKDESNTEGSDTGTVNDKIKDKKVVEWEDINVKENDDIHSQKRSLRSSVKEKKDNENVTIKENSEENLEETTKTKKDNVQSQKKSAQESSAEQTIETEKSEIHNQKRSLRSGKNVEEKSVEAEKDNDARRKSHKNQTTSTDKGNNETINEIHSEKEEKSSLEVEERDDSKSKRKSLRSREKENGAKNEKEEESKEVSDKEHEVEQETSEENTEKNDEIQSRRKSLRSSNKENGDKNIQTKNILKASKGSNSKEEKRKSENEKDKKESNGHSLKSSNKGLKVVKSTKESSDNEIKKEQKGSLLNMEIDNSDEEKNEKNVKKQDRNDKDIEESSDDPQSQDGPSESSEDDTILVERVTRSGKKITNIDHKSKKSKGFSKNTEQDNNSKSKPKNLVDKIKKESSIDEQDSSDSASRMQPSRKSKDRAKNLTIQLPFMKKTNKPGNVVTILSSSEEEEPEKVLNMKSKVKKPTVKSERSSSTDSKTTSSNTRSGKKLSRGKSSSNDSDSDSGKLKKSKIKRKKSKELSSDSDFETKRVSKTKKKSNARKSLNYHSDSDDQHSDLETKPVAKNKKNQMAKNRNSFKDSEENEDSEEEEPKHVKAEYSLEESSEEESSGSSSSSSHSSPNRKGSKGKQKQTRKRPRPAESSESSHESSSQESTEESSDDENIATRTRKRKKIQTDSSDEAPKSRQSKAKRQKKTNKKRRIVKKKKAAVDSDSDASEEEEESGDSQPEVKGKSTKGKGKKPKGKGKKQASKNKKRSRIKKNSDESSNEDDESKSPSKGRKKIRKILTDDKLDKETLKARRLEEERRKRLLERTRTAENEELPRKSWNLNAVVLEKDKETKEPLIEIHSDLVQHLKPHQSKGIQFMYDNIIDSISAYKKGDKGGGCILAHCMGLGKTLQVVSLIHTIFNHKDFDFTTALIIAPLNTVLNWQVEFDKWLSVDERMNVFVLKEAGHNNWHRVDMLKQWQRFGGIMIIGYDAYRNLSQCTRVRSKHQKKIFKETLIDPGPDLVVCDEGHILRNDQSAVSKAINAIKTRRRIVLTGTPLQNNLIEYHCMVSFVKPNLLGTRKEFMNLFGNPIMNGQCVDSNPLDVRIMKQSCHVLYKLLEACVQRRDYSVLTPFLPPKHEYVVKVRLSEVQKKLYSHYLSTFVFPEGAITGRGPSLFSDYQALMRIWTHPWCLKLEAIRRSLRAPYSDSDNSLDGFVVNSDEEEESESSDSDAMSLKSDSSTPKKKKNAAFELKSSSSSEESDENNTSDEEVMPQPSNRMTRSNGPVKEEKQSNKNTPMNDQYESNTRSGNNFKEDIQEEKEWYDEFLSPNDEYNVELSGKLAILLEILADAEAVEEKVLVFSQSLVTLDLIERALGGGEVGGDRENWCRGCDYFRMDGSTSVHLRQRWADIFNDTDNKTARLFLISTKAGGLGINLVAANRVVVFDVSWNPSHDVQSIFRVYRFGQTKPVYVYRLVSEIAKLSTSQRVIDKHQIERHFTAKDLAELYRFTPTTFDEQTNTDDIPKLPLPKDAVLADLINRMHPKWIVKYHEHDSLLQNKTEEELTEEECKQAWASYEAQKNRPKNQYDVSVLQAQYAQQQLEQQRQSVPQNMTMSNAVLLQMQQLQRQQLSERIARLQAGAPMQTRPYQPQGQPIRFMQLKPGQLTHYAPARPVFQPRPGTSYQPMVSYVSQQRPQGQVHRIGEPRLPIAAQPNPIPQNAITIRHTSPPPYSRV